MLQRASSFPLTCANSCSKAPALPAPAPPRPAPPNPTPSRPVPPHPTPPRPAPPNPNPPCPAAASSAGCTPWRSAPGMSLTPARRSWRRGSRACATSAWRTTGGLAGAGLCLPRLCWGLEGGWVGVRSKVLACGFAGKRGPVGSFQGFLGSAGARGVRVGVFHSCPWPSGHGDSRGAAWSRQPLPAALCNRAGCLPDPPRHGCAGG